jgi:hypothetical protein
MVKITIKKSATLPMLIDWTCSHNFVRTNTTAAQNTPDSNVSPANQPTCRVILTAYLIADDTDERGLYNYEYGKTKGIYRG